MKARLLRVDEVGEKIKPLGTFESDSIYILE